MYNVGNVVRLKNTGDSDLDGSLCLIVGLPRQDCDSDVHTVFGDFKKWNSKNLVLNITSHCFELELDEIIVRHSSRWFVDTLKSVL